MFAVLAVALCAVLGVAQQPGAGGQELSGRVVLSTAAMKAHAPSIVVWLTPVETSTPVKAPAPGRFKLVQKNRAFAPHLLVIPVGSTISFPNEDPFFHNVFSMFNGKRFDLGLYPAGSSRQVNFSREGVSYIFCNIHAEMSAVVVALATPLYAVADPSGAFSIHGVPPGAYELHVWIEGTPQPDLDRLTRKLSVTQDKSVNVMIDASTAYHGQHGHLDMFGKPYSPATRPPY